MEREKLRSLLQCIFCIFVVIIIVNITLSLQFVTFEIIHYTPQDNHKYILLWTAFFDDPTFQLQ